mgnify:CR=1 FL=1
MISGKEKERELIIKFSKENKTCREIATLLGTSKSKVSYWINRSRQTATLSDLPRSGRPTILSKKNLSNLRSKLRKEELASNMPGFSSKKVSEMLNKTTGKQYSMRHVRRILKKMNIALITPRPFHIKNDPKKVAEFRREFKKNSKKNIWTTNSSLLTK